MSRVLVSSVLVLLMCGTALGQKDLKSLPEPYKTWLREEVNYIISDVERKAFLRLESNQERDAFIEVFWRKRDENPATPENEYKIEHYKRLAYVNKFFGRDTFRKGWQTDMGKYYILLGPPRTHQNFEPRDEVYPAELWFYNDARLQHYNLPPFFYLLFFRRHGIGEMELYNPLTDGPQALLTRVNTVSMDFRRDVERAYNDLMQVDPELAAASLSFRTDEGDLAQFQSPAFGSIELVADIAESPFVDLDTSYAERLDFERGAVESDYMFTFVPSVGMINILPGPENAAYLHWVIQLDAPNVAFVRDQDTGKYATIFIASMEVVPRDDPDKLVVEYRKESFIELDASDEPMLRRPFSYSGMTPIVPGEYDVRIILRNRACPSREEKHCIRGYTLLDGAVRVPEWSADHPALGDLVLAYEQQMRGGEPVYRAYRFGNVQIHPNPSGVYAINDKVVAAVQPASPKDGDQIRFRIVGANPPAEGAEKTLFLDETVPVSGTGPVVKELSLERFEAGQYTLRASLVAASGKEVDSKSVPLVVSPRTAILRPAVRGSAAQIPAESPGAVAQELGQQYLALEQPEKARSTFERALRQNRKLGPAREQLARFELADGNGARVIELLSPVYAEVPDRFEVLALLGQAYFQQKDYARSVELLEKAIVLRRPRVPVLNILANAQYRVGNLGRALELLERSLSLEPKQEGIEKLLDKLREEQRAAPPGS